MSRLSHIVWKKQIIGLIVLAMVIVGLKLGFEWYEKTQKQQEIKIEFIKKEDKPVILTMFDPNDLDEEAWQNLGFTKKQVKTILKYKEIIGGEYLSKQQFRKCYAVSDEKYKQLEKFILLPEKHDRFSKNYKSHRRDIVVSKRFNPDDFSQKDWEQLGFSEKQAVSILKYKNYLGGSFLSKEKFRKCFTISPKNYEKLAPYLILPEKVSEEFAKNIKYSKKESRKIELQPFNPNALDVEGWKRLGFTEKQSQVIVNYRDRQMKGNFKSLEDIKNCFVISEEKFDLLKPFIQIKVLENSIVNQSIKKVESKTDFNNIDINKISYKQLLEFGFEEKESSIFVGFRKKLGGFINEKQILEIYNIDKEKLQQLVHICKLDNSSVQKYTLIDAPEEWLQNHPYFKYSADKIIYYRTTYPDDKKIWKLLKLKPEYEEKMKWYLY